MPGKKDKGAKKVVALAAELAVAGMTGRIWEVKDAEEIVEFCVTLAEGILDSLEGDD